ncbi:hypothetical protein N018_05560 [Pseudomonas syringae CC1557]|uniref:Uncharacterized protein n=1 Tax=Pseudomonas syringae CC1557 TaxID=1357279 RepID=W0N385_PSESX|nr:hypothetical protein [Pseudomonas syringae]AHG43506.1 hypothetical protein N018_05560 [Pseudomonas syringae CC1557]
MKNLSFSKAKALAALAFASYQQYEATSTTLGKVVDATDIAQQLAKPLSAERMALEHEMEHLSRSEALDLNALMYLGRDYLHSTDFQDKNEIRAIFDSYTTDFSSEDTEQLIGACLEKDLVLHQYLAIGLKCIDGAY